MPLAQTAQAYVQSAAPLAEAQRARWASQLTVALAAHQQIATPSRRLTHGKPLTQCKIVNAYDPTIAPICKGKSNCPTQFGRKPGIIAEPAAGFIFALQLPVATRLYLPQAWAEDAARCQQAQVPEAVPLQTKAEIALARLDEANTCGVGHACVTGEAD